MSQADFLMYQAQTSPHPLALEISYAKGSYLYDTQGKAYLDFIAGVSANSLGHCHPKIIEAITKQVNLYSHIMVYGEYIQQPQVSLCKELSKTVTDDNFMVYLTNSGTEATEGALKLAKRVSGRSEIIAAKNSYHGSTQGAMSVCGLEAKKRAFRPLLPGVKFITFNEQEDLLKITNTTAAVILETIQGGAGFVVPKAAYLQKVKQRCDKVGALLILDETQTGVGRTGTFWGFENYGITPDIIVAGKGLGGGMPIGVFMAAKQNMALLKEDPELGHITTFGGHPLIASAALATLGVIASTNLIEETLRKEQLFRTYLQHQLIEEVRGKGLMLAIIVPTPALASTIIKTCLQRGLLLFWLLYENSAIRITPPLTITDAEIKKGCHILLSVMDACMKTH